MQIRLGVHCSGETRPGCRRCGHDPGHYRPGRVHRLVEEVFEIPGRTGVRPGDRLVALPSSGLHTNGYSLARTVLFQRLGLDPGDPYPGLSGETVGQALLRVHRSYLEPLRGVLESHLVRALAHITGGGIPGTCPGFCHGMPTRWFISIPGLRLHCSAFSPRRVDFRIPTCTKH